ncbi:MAG: hypothetical protein KME64_33910 [Scytonematopsis contorta HA4267-MV1]|jgi:hypothetical protein|nr:hypothetical protein [Scytonematopsis contorta HA4267-MV1]
MPNYAKEKRGKERAICLVETLLRLVYTDQSVDMNNWMQGKVQVKWTSSDILHVTGTIKDKGGKDVESGTTLDNLLELVKHYKCDNHNLFNKRTSERDGQPTESKPIDDIRGAINLLKDGYKLLEDARLNGKAKNSKYWKFNILIENNNAQKKTLKDNLEFVKKHLGLSSIDAQDSDRLTTDAEDEIQSINASTNIDNDTVKILLRSLNCENHKHLFKQQMGNAEEGFFLIQAERDVYPWLLWVLEEDIAGLETAKPVKVKIDCWDFAKEESNSLWLKIGNEIGLNSKLNSNIKNEVINTLNEFYKTKTVIISIVNHNCFTQNELEIFSNFYNELCSQMTFFRKKTKCLLLFLIQTEQNTIEIIQKVKGLTSLKLEQIPQGEVNIWLVNMQNKKLDKKINFEVNEEVHEKVANFPNAPYKVIHNICRLVFEKDMVDFESYWKHWR